jgi:hypothetical protein
MSSNFIFLCHMSEMCGDGVYLFIFYFCVKVYMDIYKPFEEIKFKIFVY